MVVALAQDQAPDVGQGWMDGWVAGRGSGSVCFCLAGLCVLSIQLPVCCLWMAGKAAGRDAQCFLMWAFFSWLR